MGEDGVGKGNRSGSLEGRIEKIEKDDLIEGHTKRQIKSYGAKSIRKINIACKEKRQCRSYELLALFSIFLLPEYKFFDILFINIANNIIG